jgi:putative transposase
MSQGSRSRFAFTLTASQKEELESLRRRRSAAHGLARRADILLLSAEGKSIRAIADKLGVATATVGLWRKRFATQGLAGLHDAARPGRPREYGDEQIADLIEKTLHQKPKGQMHWSVREAARETAFSKSTVQRVFHLFGLQPHRQKTFQLSTDPYFVEKVRDIVGLYLNPPDKALVLCVDEKSQVQALERSQPILPIGLGYVEGVTHNYIRHGTTTLFAALDISKGEVLTQCHKRHRHQEFLTFLRHIDENVPAELELHLVLDNYATHKHPKVRAWLAKRPRYHLHFTPTYSSWLNQVERWFGIITQKAIRRGSFQSVKELVRRIQEFALAYNQTSRPFLWTATANSILDKIQRLCKLIG